MVSIADGQEFKVIKETNDYILKELDSGYYSTHGIRAKNGFVRDKKKTYKENGILRLPLNNGKFLEYRDSILVSTNYPKGICGLEMVDKQHGFYIVDKWYGNNDGYRVLINMDNGKTELINYTPSLSVDSNRYGYIFRTIKSKKWFVKSINLKTNKSITIPLGKDLRCDMGYFNNLKWIDEKTFIYNTAYFDEKKKKDSPFKYYLVEIKH